ncbi:olfactory receptor 5I1-like [Rana temporaria]|uniref:olfactory receptor 5I1-like n=1 Tax=Rana temporaria TaxID=8407 RepID=UPI001AADE24C|nr:olfactory receptor 5I1-like [Rana temporaria]
MAHLWWLCPQIQSYWDTILTQIKVITGEEIKKDPWVVLFHGSLEGVKKYKQSLLPHLLNAAKRLIPKKWQEKESPHVWNWIDEVEETYSEKHELHYSGVNGHHLYNRSDTFYLLGFGEQSSPPFLLFALFLSMYLVTVFGNLGITALILTNDHLQSPMYFFLSNLAFIDLFYSSCITPKMLVDLISAEKSISYVGCACQMYFFIALGSTESFLLAAMAIDRYAAICNPLLYLRIMTKEICLKLLSGSYFGGFLHSLIQTCSTFRLSFCGSHEIDHFLCDIPPLLKLSCMDTTTNELILSIFAFFVAVGCVIVIVISYTLILRAVFRSTSFQGRLKAFSTCGSHFICVILFYSTILFTYLRPSSIYSLQTDKIISVVYTMVIPMLNPLIYSLRNREIKLALRHFIQTFRSKSF